MARAVRRNCLGKVKFPLDKSAIRCYNKEKKRGKRNETDECDNQL